MEQMPLSIWWHRNHSKEGTEDDLILLKKISASIVAVKENEFEEFNLESFEINTDGFIPNCDNIQEIDFSQERDFIIPEGDCRSEIRFFRMPTLDIAGYSAYEFIYPFKVRWEEWRSLSGANRCFSQPTQNWTVYGNTLGWSIKFSLKAEVEDESTGHITEFENITWGAIKDPCDVPYSVEFNTYDSTGVFNFEEVVAKDDNTLVVATITGDFSGHSESKLYGILTLDAWGIGGVAYSREIGSRINVDSDFVWSGVDSNLVAKLQKVSNNTVTVSALLNYLYLPADTNQFILSARIGEYNSEESSSGATCLNEVIVDAFTCAELGIIQVVDANTLIVSGDVISSDFRNIFADSLVLVFVTATTWKVTGGYIGGNPVSTGTVGGNIVKAPAHPYSDSNVGDTFQGEITGTTYSSVTEINGIGEMQIGCTFFVS